MTFRAAPVHNKKHPRPQPLFRYAAGFTLLEVLVAVVVLAIGLLGIAGIQAISIRNNQSAYLRSQATILAYDILERMRANTTLAKSGSYSVALGSTGSGTGMALTDITEWKSVLADVLPSGDGSVTVDLVGNATVELRWVDRVCAPESVNDGSDTNCPVNPNCPSTASANLQCFITQTKI